MSEILKSSALLLAILNPFLVIVYLLELVQQVERPMFRRILIRAGIIACFCFCIFAVMGDVIFKQIVQAEFASFQIFGGIVLLMIGLKFVFEGPGAIEMLRGEPEQVAGAVAMPVLIGPGSLSASVLIGEKLSPASACFAIIIAVAGSIGIMLLLKQLHDFVRPRSEGIVKRYIEVVGRIMALYIGTIAVDMIMRGWSVWCDKF